MKHPLCAEDFIRFFGSEVIHKTQSQTRKLKPRSRKTKLYNKRIISHIDAPPALQATYSEGSEEGCSG